MEGSGLSDGERQALQEIERALCADRGLDRRLSRMERYGAAWRLGRWPGALALCAVCTWLCLRAGSLGGAVLFAAAGAWCVGCVTALAVRRGMAARSARRGGDR
ncbi:DUF3040 domain-containing protein [Streptomyces sp. G-G2]|uniref:DUF3040 domain-containing protein n=1 Tax=Streptomyces sp. G-G2 TaxID=3046201 RepID=UPI0024BACACF|nr:DUF3040 domain-containing protein [Streptomyces sp. G-G2]MDJ0386199.1 DUF3040 domain-containing protein [Streptomyces sp. G-G2]